MLESSFPETGLICLLLKKVMSPYDEFAVETALQHREAVGGEVTAITVGDSGADKVLKDAKAIGVDHIVRIDCTESLDSNALQSILAATVSDLGAHAVYCGKPQQTPVQVRPVRGWLKDWVGHRYPTASVCPLENNFQS